MSLDGMVIAHLMSAFLINTVGNRVPADEVVQEK